MITLEDVQKIQNNAKRFKYVDLGGKQTLVYAEPYNGKIEGEIVADPRTKRVAALSILLNTACTIKAFDSEEATQAYTRTTLEQMVPFFNDFEELIKKSYSRGHFDKFVELEAGEVEALLEAHEEDTKNFYNVVDEILVREQSLQIIAEHALDMDLTGVKSHHVVNPPLVEPTVLTHD
ncbi:MAG: hypothetical protein E7375_02330 [Clostridiales bacterium]|nr:hypothetical protein [Clostridiales bacterium]